MGKCSSSCDCHTAWGLVQLVSHDCTTTHMKSYTDTTTTTPYSWGEMLVDIHFNWFITNFLTNQNPFLYVSLWSSRVPFPKIMLVIIKSTSLQNLTNKEGPCVPKTTHHFRVTFTSYRSYYCHTVMAALKSIAELQYSFTYNALWFLTVCLLPISI